MWLLIGIAISIAAIIEHNNFLLLPAVYFMVGAIANIGCFAQSCAVDFKNNKDAEPIKSAYEDVHFKNDKS
jgi:hypothetical protein